MSEVFFVFSILNMAVLVYIYFGYPILLVILTRFAPGKSVEKGEIRPKVSLLISCYNEEKVIREKLRNSLALNYPHGKLEIIVISDGSTDRTDQIACEFEKKGVVLLRQEGRLGKTCGLNYAVPQATGEIIVFSDANAMYRPDAIMRLVENFADETVGYVVGEARYVDAERSPASDSENTYWAYEIAVKKMESKVSSMVGGDGAIYAIRKALYEPLLEMDINDFVNPLQIIAKGFRGIYEPSAICLEETSGKFEKEFRRKVRIVNRSFSGLLRVKSVMNPFRTGLFSLQILSHKVLRWFACVFIANFFVSSFYLALKGSIFFQVVVAAELAAMFCAYIGYISRDDEKAIPIFYQAYYFGLVNVAALFGLYKSIRGTVQVTWEPHRIETRDDREAPIAHVAIHTSAAVLLLSFLLVLQSFLKIDMFVWKAALWTAFALILYTYFGYPLILFIWSALFPAAVSKSPCTPTVDILTCAYNEEETIEKKISNFQELNYPREKVRLVVASDGSTDATVEIAKKFENDRISVIEYPKRRGKIGVINETVAQLEGEILLFSDANTMLEKNSVERMVWNFSDEQVGGVSANVVLISENAPFGAGESLYYKYERFIQEKESLVESIIGADGGMYGIRRDFFSAPPGDTILDDFVISMNVALQGKRVVFDREVVGYEDNPISCRDEFFRKSRVIAGAVQTLKRCMAVPSMNRKKLLFCYLSHKLLRWSTPILLVVLLFASARLAVGGQGAPYSLLLGIYAAFFLLSFAGFLTKHRKNAAPLIVPYYYCLENAAALYGVYKGVFNRQSVRWRKMRGKKSEVSG